MPGLYCKLLKAWLLLLILWVLVGYKIRPSHKPPAKLPRLLIYGDVYGFPLLPELNASRCREYKDLELVRSDRIVRFDIVFLHFSAIQSFLHEYKPIVGEKKKLMIIASMESPFEVGSNINVFELRKHFTLWSSSYYSSSAVPMRYGHFDYYKSKKKHKSSNVELQKEFKRRLNKGLAIISNCDTKYTVRLKYIDKLKQYFNISLFGECFSEQIDDNKKIEMLKSHKFYLSFENNHCAEFYSNRYIEALTHGVIPVFLSSNMVGDSSLIPGSYVNVYAHSNPEALAHTLLKISSDFRMYRKFFLWKTKYKLDTSRHLANQCSAITRILKGKDIITDPTIFMMIDTLFCESAETVADKLLVN